MSRREVTIELGVMALAAAVLAIAGPFGTFAAPLGLRFAYWLVFAIGGYAFFRPVIAAGDALAAASALPRWAAVACACAFAAFPTTLLVCWAISGWRIDAIMTRDLFRAYPQVLLVGGVVTAIQFVIGERRAPPPLPASAAAAQPAASAEMSPSDAPPPPADLSFLRRLPASLGGPLLCLEMEDHYVRAHTAAGSALILMRLRDAIAELDGIEGARVHRSWWVARAAVAGVERRDRAVSLRLVNGAAVPVARNELPALRSAGWL